MKRTLLCAVMLALSGCATVRSNHFDAQPIATNRQEGLSYFLPARFVKLTATRELLDPASLKLIVDQKSKELEAAKATLVAAKAAVADKQALLSNLPSDATTATRDAALTALQTAKAGEAVATSEVTNLTQTVNGLKQMLQTAQTSGTNSCTYSAKLELLPAHPDPAARFVARPIHNPLRDDTTKLVVTDAGLLSSSNVVADDKTGQIIVELAGAFGAFGGYSPSIAPADPSEMPEVVNCDKTAKKFIKIFDPADPRVNVAAELAAAHFPLVVEINSIDGSALTLPEIGMNDNSSKAATTAAIFYRSAVPLRITVRECLNGQLGCAAADSNIIDESLVMIPQAGPLAYIPMRSSAFVKTVNDVQFENGMIKSWSAERPSEVLEVVRLPVKVLTALVSVPASMFQLRVNYNNNARSLADAQLAEIKASEKLAALRSCLLAADDDTAKSKACLTD